MPQINLRSICKGAERSDRRYVSIAVAEMFGMGAGAAGLIVSEKTDIKETLFVGGIVGIVSVAAFVYTTLTNDPKGHPRINPPEYQKPDLDYTVQKTDGDTN